MSKFNTPLEALYACRNHWSWLAITGSEYKTSYRPSKDWTFYCACCEYMGHIGGGSNVDGEYVCNYCPLTGYAWNRAEDFETAPCETDYTNSIYDNWEGAYSQEHLTKYALQMVQACNRAIEDILLNSSEEGK